MPYTISTAFLPSRHGFVFPNQFRNGRAITTFGRCNGMAWTALDYFNAGRSPPDVGAVDFERPLESPLAAAITPDGTVQLFAWRYGGPNDLVGKTVRGVSFGDWGRCIRLKGGSVGLAACCWGPGRTDLLVGGEDGRLRHIWYEGPALSDERRQCSGLFATDPDPSPDPTAFWTDRQPAIAAPFPDRLELWAVGRDRNLWFRYYDGDWHGWNSRGRPLGRDIPSGCAAVSHHGFMGGYVRGADGAMWEQAWENGGWQPWRSVGGSFTSGPAAASPFPGRVELYGRAPDGRIHIAIREGRNWGPWASLGMPPGGARDEAPAAVARSGLLDLFVRANDARTWRRRWEGGGWHDWEMIESPVSTTSKRLTDAIYSKMMTSTHDALIPATIFLGLGLPFIGPKANFITWRTPSNETTFGWSATGELRKLHTLLPRGPVPLGLLDFTSWGHEVVAFGLESDSNLPPGSFELPGDAGYGIRIYDPNHPGCDNIRINFHGRDLRRSPITADSPALRSSTGEPWKAFFVRDDYAAAPPPV
jgi:hypothetical protein